MDCYFRQSWVDERLAFSETEESFTLSLSVLERLWKPDTFIYNGKHSYAHLLTTPNRFFRLHHSGKILYSSRLTIQATCPMNLEDFPMDTQRCPLQFGSFGYTTNDVLYRWNEKRQLVIAADMKLSQFDLIGAPSGFENKTRRKDEHSTLMASFYLQRHMGNFLIQVYGPCMLLVVLSWVSFWLNREATADRISLGVTTVLTMTFLGLEARKDLPKVPYSTALDWFVWISFGFIFATILEFAFVHSFTKFGSGEDLLSDIESDLEEVGNFEEVVTWKNIPVANDRKFLKGSENRSRFTEHSVILESRETLQDVYSPEDLHSSLPRHIERNLSLNATRAHQSHVSNSNTSDPQGIQDDKFISLETDKANAKVHGTKSEKGEECSKDLPLQVSVSALEVDKPIKALCPACSSRLTETRISSPSSEGSKEKYQRNKKSLCRLILTFCCKDDCNIPKARKRVQKARTEESKKRVPKDQQMNSVSNLDETSRVLFPLSFFLINLLYWYSYLSHSQRLIHNLEPPTYAPSPY